MHQRPGLSGNLAHRAGGWRASAPGARGFHALPKGDVAFDAASGLFWLGVVPGGAGVDLTIDHHVVVIGGALPMAAGGLR